MSLAIKYFVVLSLTNEDSLVNPCPDLSASGNFVFQLFNFSLSYITFCDSAHFIGDFFLLPE